jgi:hypothetical protein
MNYADGTNVEVSGHLFYKCIYTRHHVARSAIHMESQELSSDPRIDRIWEKYTELFKHFRIPVKAIPYYRRHIEGFLADHPDIRLRSHSAETVEQWLECSGGNPDISEWQFRQKVDTLRILMGHFLRMPWSIDFD